MPQFWHDTKCVMPMTATWIRILYSGSGYMNFGHGINIDLEFWSRLIVC